jgi:hypothetical protein
VHNHDAVGQGVEQTGKINKGARSLTFSATTQHKFSLQASNIIVELYLAIFNTSRYLDEIDEFPLFPMLVDFDM